MAENDVTLEKGAAEKMPEDIVEERNIIFEEAYFAHNTSDERRRNSFDFLQVA